MKKRAPTLVQLPTASRAGASSAEQRIALTRTMISNPLYTVLEENQALRQEEYYKDCVSPDGRKFYLKNLSKTKLEPIFLKKEVTDQHVTIDELFSAARSIGGRQGFSCFHYTETYACGLKIHIYFNEHMQFVNYDASPALEADEIEVLNKRKDLLIQITLKQLQIIEDARAQSLKSAQDKYNSLAHKITKKLETLSQATLEEKREQKECITSLRDELLALHTTMEKYAYEGIPRAIVLESAIQAYMASITVKAAEGCSTEQLELLQLSSAISAEDKALLLKLLREIEESESIKDTTAPLTPEEETSLYSKTSSPGSSASSCEAKRTASPKYTPLADPKLSLSAPIDKNEFKKIISLYNDLKRYDELYLKARNICLFYISNEDNGLKFPIDTLQRDFKTLNKLISIALSQSSYLKFKAFQKAAQRVRLVGNDLQKFIIEEAIKNTQVNTNPEIIYVFPSLFTGLKPDFDLLHKMIILGDFVGGDSLIDRISSYLFQMPEPGCPPTLAEADASLWHSFKNWIALNEWLEKHQPSLLKTIHEKLIHHHQRSLLLLGEKAVFILIKYFYGYHQSLLSETMNDPTQKIRALKFMKTSFQILMKSFPCHIRESYAQNLRKLFSESFSFIPDTLFDLPEELKASVSPKLKK